MKEFIRKHFGFGSQKALAAELGVTEQTIGNWIRYNPRGILKHAQQIVEENDITYLQLHGEVEYREHEIKELEPIREGEV
jgi:predicted transcriptional regulator